MYVCVFVYVLHIGVKGREIRCNLISSSTIQLFPNIFGFRIICVYIFISIWWCEFLGVCVCVLCFISGRAL